ncbi:hypothetical protein KPATCC21470_0807 [Kitasatospora purpeofusca]
MRAVVWRTAIGPPARRFLRPLWDLVGAGVSVRLIRARTTLA